MNNVENLLPIGTIVYLQDAIKPLMIVGYFPVANDEKKRDYSAVMYPEGLVLKDAIFSFNHKDIKKIEKKGYENYIFKNFKKNLNTFFKSGGNK